MTRADFLIQFPEFEAVDTAQIDAFLAAALLEIDADIWGAKADQGQAYLTAHKLALSPFGNGTRQVPKDYMRTPHGTTTYGAEYDALVRQVSHGYRVA